jgi:hypothetical protein
MTDLPDDEPQPGSRAWMEQTAQLDSAMATARRYLSALNAQDHPACNAILVELACDRDGSMVKVFMTLAAQALDFASVPSTSSVSSTAAACRSISPGARCNSSTSPRSTRSSSTRIPRASGRRRPRLDRADIPHTDNRPNVSAARSPSYERTFMSDEGAGSRPLPGSRWSHRPSGLAQRGRQPAQVNGEPFPRWHSSVAARTVALSVRCESHLNCISLQCV